MNLFLRAGEQLSWAADGGTVADREGGSTALRALVPGPQLLVANAGDSRCIGSWLGLALGLGLGVRARVMVKVRARVLKSIRSQ